MDDGFLMAAQMEFPSPSQPIYVKPFWDLRPMQLELNYNRLERMTGYSDFQQSYRDFKGVWKLEGGA